MKRAEFRALTARRPLLLDGATGTELVNRGLPPGVAPEKWVLDNPAIVRELQRRYYEAGSDAVATATFGCNRIKLNDHGLGSAARDMNRRLADISRAVVPAGRLLFGDMSPTGLLVEPFGPLAFEEAVAVYREQAEALRDGGVDGFLVETMLDVQEARAALLAIREAAPDMPALVTLTFEANGLTLGGTPPAAAVVILQSLGADAVGANCSRGPADMIPLLGEMTPYARVPLVMKPNAGMPCLRDGRAEYSLGPVPFAEAILGAMTATGIAVVGGCCGTTPDHIRELRARLDGAAAPVPGAGGGRAAAGSSRRLVDFSPREDRSRPLVVIGERINPTGKKKFQAELLAGEFGRVLDFAEEQAAAGAEMLDVNLGLGGLNEAAALRQAVAMLAPATPLPLAVDSVDPMAMEAALRLYPGRALVNSVSGEHGRIEHILPLAARYGAMLIVLPVGEGHIPATAPERLAVAREIVAAAEKLGVSRDDMLVDGLAMTISANPAAGCAALDFIAACSAENLRTILGLSNVSFGMPERQWLNAVFLAMAMAKGLTAVIANPSAALLLETKTSADALRDSHDGVAAYIARFAPAAAPPGGADGAKHGETVPAKEASGPAALAAHAVLKGDVKRAAALAAAAVAAGVRAGELLSGHLAPAIVEAGALFERNIYYLPQLMLAGEAMRRALEAIEPALADERDGGDAGKGRVIMATVRGDVHDIGKNLVALMLRNHGFEVHDLGKDVPPETVTEAALRLRVDVVGLSALMTTTLTAMRETICHARRAGVAARFMVGGAAVTERFAAEAGADGYAPDAVSAVKEAERLAGRAP